MLMLKGKSKMKKLDKKYVIVIFVAILIILEQLTKVVVLVNKDKLPINVIENIFMISYVENSGAAFGIKVGSVWSFVAINIVVLGIIIKFIYSQLSELNNKTIVIFSLVLAGGISNLIDRIFRGYVIDFISVKLYKFPVFNTADIIITVSIIILIIIILSNCLKSKK